MPSCARPIPTTIQTTKTVRVDRGATSSSRLRFLPPFRLYTSSRVHIFLRLLPLLLLTPVALPSSPLLGPKKLDTIYVFIYYRIYFSDGSIGTCPSCGAPAYGCGLCPRPRCNVCVNACTLRFRGGVAVAVAVALTVAVTVRLLKSGGGGGRGGGGERERGGGEEGGRGRGATVKNERLKHKSMIWYNVVLV